MLSVAADRPVAPPVVDVLTLVDHVARDIRLDYFVTGAMARDLVLYHVFGVETGRATLDVDLGVALDSWPEFERLKTRLIATGIVTEDNNRPHRLFYSASSGVRGLPLDLLPFGRVERRPGEIAWPPDLALVMNVAGYREALAAAEHVELGSGLVVRVASLPSLAVLKLLAWNDRGVQDSRDARDLAVLLRSYSEAGNLDRLYGIELGLLEEVDYNLDLAGPRLLGKDAARIIARPTRIQVLALLRDPGRVERLTEDMARVLRRRRSPFVNGLGVDSA